MAATYEELANIIVKAHALHPVWFVQAAVNEGSEPSPPNTTLDGQALNDAIITKYRVKLRRDPAVRRSDITVTVGVGDAYVATINGNVYSYTAIGGDTPTDILNALKVLIDAGAEPGMTTSVEAGPILRIVADTYTCVVSLVGVAGGTISMDAEASQVDFYVHLLPKNHTPVAGDEAQWDIASSAGFTAQKNATENVLTAGASRMFVQVASTNGNNVIPEVGPCQEVAP